MTLYYLTRRDSSERITGRDGEPSLYTNQTAAALGAEDMQHRLGFEIDHISVDAWHETFHAPVVAAKRAIGSRDSPSAIAGKRALEILRAILDAGDDDINAELDEAETLLDGLDA